MKTNERLIYQLVLLASLHFPSDKVRDIAEDYTEYLNMKEPSEKTESPRHFFTAILREEGRYRPRIKTMLAVFAALFLTACGIWGKGPAMFSFLAAGLPAAVWTAVSGNTAARYSPRQKHAVLCTVTLPFLCAALPAVWFVLIMDAFLTGKSFVSPDTAQIFHFALRVYGGASLLLFLASACLLWKRSIWFFCLLTQAVSGWCFFKSLHFILTRMDVSVMYHTEHFRCLLPLILGLAVSLAFALRLRKITGRGYVQWMDK